MGCGETFQLERNTNKHTLPKPNKRGAWDVLLGKAYYQKNDP